MKKLLVALTILLPFMADSQICYTTFTLSATGSNPLCAGAPDTLSATGNRLATFVWSNGSTASSIIVNPATTTQYYCEIIDSNGCIAGDTLTITVSSPVVNAYSNTQNLICSGVNDTLLTSVEGTAPFTYQWSPAAWLNSGILSNVIASSPQTIEYTIIITDAFGCTASSKITVNVDSYIANIKQSPSQVCLGAQVVLTSGTSGGAKPFTYFWMPGGITKVSDTVIASSAAPTPYNITITDSIGCSSLANTFINTDFFNTWLPPTTAICANPGASPLGAANGLNPQISGGGQPYTYLWNTGNTNSLLPFSGLTSGIYLVNITDANGCSSAAIDTLTVLSTPTITITSSQNPIIQIGWADTLTASGGTSYKWSDGETTSQITVKPRASSDYSVTGWSSAGCSNQAFTTIVVTRDYFIPSPDTLIPHNPGFPPIYYAGNVSVGGKDSAYSPTQALAVHGNEKIDSVLTLGNSGITINGNTATISSPTNTLNFACDTLATCGKLKAGSMNISGNSVAMPGIVNDTNRDLMTIDRNGNITPLSIQGLQSLANETQPFLYNGPCSSGGPYSTGFQTTTTTNTENVTWTEPCTWVGIGTNAPDAPLNISNTTNANKIVFSITDPSSSTDNFTIDYFGNTSNKGDMNIDGAATIIGNTKIDGLAGIGISPSTLTTLNVLGKSSQYTTLLSTADLTNAYDIMADIPQVNSSIIGLAVHISAGSQNYDVFDVDGSGNTYIAGTIGIGTHPSTNAQLNISVPSSSTTNPFSVSNSSGTNLVIIDPTGKVVIGSDITSPFYYNTTNTYGLYVENGILTQSVKIALYTDHTNWSDYVLGNNYKLLSLTDLAKYVKENHHLPDVPSAADVQKDGIDVAEMDATLLKKIEELTLYMLQQQKQSDDQQQEIKELKAKLEVLEKKQK